MKNLFTKLLIIYSMFFLNQNNIKTATAATSELRTHLTSGSDSDLEIDCDKLITQKAIEYERVLAKNITSFTERQKIAKQAFDQGFFLSFHIGIECHETAKRTGKILSLEAINCLKKDDKKKLYCKSYNLADIFERRLLMHIQYKDTLRTPQIICEEEQLFIAQAVFKKHKIVLSSLCKTFSEYHAYKQQRGLIFSQKTTANVASLKATDIKEHRIPTVKRLLSNQAFYNTTKCLLGMCCTAFFTSFYKHPIITYGALYGSSLFLAYQTIHNFNVIGRYFQPPSDLTLLIYGTNLHDEHYEDPENRLSSDITAKKFPFRTLMPYRKTIILQLFTALVTNLAISYLCRS